MVTEFYLMLFPIFHCYSVHYNFQSLWASSGGLVCFQLVPKISTINFQKDIYSIVLLPTHRHSNPSSMHDQCLSHGPSLMATSLPQLNGGASEPVIGRSCVRLHMLEYSDKVNCSLKLSTVPDPLGHFVISKVQVGDKVHVFTCYAPKKDSIQIFRKLYLAPNQKFKF